MFETLTFIAASYFATLFVRAILGIPYTALEQKMFRPIFGSGSWYK